MSRGAGRCHVKWWYNWIIFDSEQLDEILFFLVREKKKKWSELFPIYSLEKEDVHSSRIKGVQKQYCEEHAAEGKHCND